uniref:HECT-type E3 ubiquitin transferase n=1 Tax=Saccoglossus kowalevskii TaxID=10224 RepID=A0ABM0MQ92_SACKO|nr:PREDICTED: E3 ubiquitin-protein ligase HUWE1-like [Saccoglossus kowalevskii]
MDAACKTISSSTWILPCDKAENLKLKQLLHSMLYFTALLIEHSFSRHLYNSMEHLTALLSSSDMHTVLAVLNLVYVFSKRSNFIVKLAADKRAALLNRLSFLAESWGGKDNGFGLAQCCQDLPIEEYPNSATTLHFEFYTECKDAKSAKKSVGNTICVIHLDNVDKLAESPAHIMEDIFKSYDVPKDKQVNPKLEAFPQPFATALFSFLYHLASYEAGGEALVSCGMMESLLKVISHPGDEQTHTTFVTRAVRVVDLITNLDMGAFQTHNGLTVFIERLKHEVDICRREVPYVIRPTFNNQQNEDGERDGGLQCFPQRGALLKSMLNFLKKAIQDPAFSDSIRHVMDGSLPSSLKHVISNAEYYGPSLFLLACELVTVYVFQEPSLLSSLQESGLTDVMLHALLIKDVPATKEVLGSLPNVFSALCLNARGLQAFVKCKPFEKLFKVLLSPDYLPAMRRRRSSEPAGDTASNLGSAMDELMRHQPSLRTDATKAIIKLLEEVCAMGRDMKFICSRSSGKSETVTTAVLRVNNAENEVSSEDEEDEDDVSSTTSQTSAPKTDMEAQPPGSETRTPIPLLDYVLNVMKFVESILSNNTTDDHCREFVTQNGLIPLMGILGLPNLPIDFPSTPACQAVASVSKSVLTLAHEPQVLKQGLLHLNEVLQSLEPLHQPLEAPGGSVLLRELASCPNMAEASLSSSATPLLHAMSSAHAYIMMFVHVCRVGSSDIRSISINHWGSDLGQKVLEGLSRLYSSLVWESTILLALCTPDSLPDTCEFGKADMEKLLPKDFQPDVVAKSVKAKVEDKNEPSTSNNLRTNESATSPMDITSDGIAPMDIDDVKGDTTQDAKSKTKMSPQLTHQVKQIKPLLSASSRLGRALAELFGLLVKLCVGSPVRQRRSHHLPTVPSLPPEPARLTATSLCGLLESGLSWTPPEWSPTPRFRLTFFICSVGFTSPMLFDEKKYPYHLMLQKFMSSGGHTALFETFNWALFHGGNAPNKDGSDIPDGTGEFLDAWLMLVEKMVNTKTILESPHTLPVKASQPGFVPFSPVQFLIHTHKAAFHAVMNLWDRKPLKVYGGRMSESMLAILCHILRGESVIRWRLEKEREKEKEKEKSASASASQVLVKLAQLPLWLLVLLLLLEVVQLMDMGFSREHALEALRHTSSIEQATEWILVHPPPLPGAPDLGSEIGLSEEDQMLRAIAMSLGENVLMSTEDEEEQKKKEDEEKKKVEKRKSLEEKDKIKEEDPLEKSVLDNFTGKMLPGCLKLLDELPDTVYRICDLLVVSKIRNGDEWRDDMLMCLIQQVFECAMVLVEAAAPMTVSDTRTVSEWAKQLTAVPESIKLASRIHLFSLLFEAMKIPCAQAVEKSGVLDVLVRLLDGTQHCLAAAKDTTTPKYLAPLMLLVDLYEKTSVGTKRRKEQRKVASHTWKWFDDRNGKWCHYSASNNKTIDDAYYAGETNIRFSAGRRRYTVQFNHMVQVNEETGNRRPVMLSLIQKEVKEPQEAASQLKYSVEESADSGKKRKTEIDESLLSTSVQNQDKATERNSESKKDGVDDKKEAEAPVVEVIGLAPEQIQTIVRCCVGLISVPVDSETLHAVLRVTLRFTREHQNALLFAELDGPKMLLSLKQPSGFPGFTSLATLILRHVMEEPHTLRHTMEKVVRTAATGNIGSSICGVAAGTIGAKELHYIMRVLGPAACHNPDLFVDVAKVILRVALPTPSRRDEDEARLVGPNVPLILKTTSVKSSMPPPIDGPIKQVLCDLLNALVVVQSEEVPPQTADVPKPDMKESPPTVSEEIGQALREVGDDFIRQYSVNGTSNRAVRRQDSIVVDTEAEAGDEDHQVAESSQSSATVVESQESTTVKEKDPEQKDEASIKKSKEETAKLAAANRPLMPKSAILRLLAELVRSYAGCAAMITHYQYTGGQTPHLKEDCHVLAYIMDHLLPQCQTAGDKDTPPLSRVFLASLAACTHSTDAQSALVNEVKSALTRALAFPESAEKHSKVQALTGLISIIIDACPPTGAYHQTQTFKSQTNGMNNIIRLLLKRGLVADLSRIPHHLDLSSPSMASTVNAALKPLETLTRIVNQPTTATTTNKSTKKSGRSSETGTPGEELHADQPQGENVTVVDPSGTGTLDTTAGQDSQAAADMLDISEVESEQLGAQTQEDDHQIGDEHAMEASAELDDIMDEILERQSGNRPAVLQDTLITAPAPTRFIDQGDNRIRCHPLILVDSQDEDAHRDEEEEIGGGLADAEMASHHDSHGDDESAAEDHDDESIHDDDDSDTSACDDDDDSVSEDDHQDDDDDDDDDCDDCDDDEDGSDMEADGGEYHDIDESYDDRVQDRDDDFFVHLEEVFPGDSGFFDDGGFLSNVPSVRSYQLPVSVHDDVTNANDPAGQSIPLAPGGVSVNHPLLIRHSDQHSHITHGHSHSSRLHRAARQRHRAIHVYPPGGRHPNPPAILQRLLGPTAAADVLQLTTSLSSTMGGGQARLLVGDNDFRVLARTDDDLFDDFFHDNYNEGVGNTHISSVPSPLSRWAEESRVLDGESVHDLVAVLKPPILAILEKHRDDELAERKEKRKKENEEDVKKKQEDKEKREKELLNQADKFTVEMLESGSARTEGTQEAISNMAASIAAAAVHLGTSSVPSTLTSTTVTGIVGTPTPASDLESSLITRSSVVTASSAEVLSTPADIVSIPNITPDAPRLQRCVPSVGSTLATDLFASEQAASDSTLDTAQELTNPTAAVTPAMQTVQDVNIVDLTPGIVARYPQEGVMTFTPTASQSEPIPMNIDIQSEADKQPPPAGSVVTPPEESPDNMPSLEGSVVPSASTPTSSGSTVSTSSGAVTIASLLAEGEENVQNQESGERSSAPAETETMPISETSGAATSEEQEGEATALSGEPSAEPSISDIFQGIQLPEGVDPSFLAALPENIRQEVLQEHFGIQQPRIPAAAPPPTPQTTTPANNSASASASATATASATASGTSESSSLTQVNPEFLAALPPHIQEEVLQQERAEQQRLLSQQAGPSSQEPIDPALFIQNLPASLRQTVLQDMDDSNVALLPADMAAEAQALRREMQLRRTQERLLHENSVLSALFRSGFPGRVGGRGVTYARVSIPQSRGSNWAWGNVGRNAQAGSAGPIAKFRGRQLVDAEALTCLLVLLFVDEPKLSTGRLHRVLRNLCYHQQTRVWVIQSLLGILERTHSCEPCASPSSQTSEVVEVLPSTSPMQRTDSFKSNQPSWLSVSMDAALGCRTNVFQIQRSVCGKKASEKSHTVIQIHPQAAPVVCRHVLETLISLAKIFPSQFVPLKAKESQSCSLEDKSNEGMKPGTKPSSQVSNASASGTTKLTSKQESDFWELLVKLDNTSIGKKGKGALKSHLNSAMDKENVAATHEAPISHLMVQLSHPVVRRSAQLTDRLLRLLSLISIALPEIQKTKLSVEESVLNLPGTPARDTTLTSETPTATANHSQDSEMASGTSSVESMEAQGTNDSPKTENKKEDKKEEEEPDEPLISADNLQLAVDVLTSHSCTEEGLEDATSLLLQLSKHDKTRDSVLTLLLVGARQLGFTLCKDIKILLKELRDHNTKTNAALESEGNDDSSLSTGIAHGGLIGDRFNRGQRLVVTAPSHRKGGYELRLPSMSLFTSKTSTQLFFLRILRVIIELRTAKRMKETRERQAKEARERAREERDLAAAAEPSTSQAQGGQEQQNSTEPSTETPAATSAAPTPTVLANNLENVEAPMEVEEGQGTVESKESTSKEKPAEEDKKEAPDNLPRLSAELALDELWDTLSECLVELKETTDHHAVLVLQTAVEAFFLVHATDKDSNKPGELQRLMSREASYSLSSLESGPLSPAPNTPGVTGAPSSPFSRENSIASLVAQNLPPDTLKFLVFAETHRIVLNQILRQSTTPLGDGPFSVLVDYTRVLDFDVKRRYFRQELERMDDGMRREDLAIHLKRDNIFEDSFRELHRRSADEWKNRFYVVFEGEEGQDAGGLLREWYLIISKEIFNPMYALFMISPGDRVTYIPNPSSHCNPNHLSYFKFVGRVIAKAAFDNKLLECYFSRSFYKHILGKPVKYIDMESEDYAFYQGLVFLLEHDVKELGYDLTFSTEIEEFGVTEVRDLKPNGRNIIVTKENKHEYVNLVCQMKMTGAIRKQIDSFLEGFYDIIPKRLISIFNEQELELLISGLPTIDIDDLKANTEYHKYQLNSLQVQWFWRALRSFDQAERANFLQFVTGTSKVPLQGFTALEGMNGPQKFQIHRDDRSTDRLPVAHTCFNQLDLPAYETYDKLRHMIYLAITECTEGFGLA